VATLLNSTKVKLARLSVDARFATNCLTVESENKKRFRGRCDININTHADTLNTTIMLKKFREWETEVVSIPLEKVYLYDDVRKIG